jgi:CubicO group peptidase (beta-lactamase class C family)
MAAATAGRDGGPMSLAGAGRLEHWPGHATKETKGRGMSRGLTAEGVEALDKALARHVDRGDLPGLVALAARGDDVHVAAIGHKAFGEAEPIGRDAIFRIASVSKPVAGAAAMLLIQDGAMALDGPVRRWLPELAEPRVLRSLESSRPDRDPAHPADDDLAGAYRARAGLLGRRVRGHRRLNPSSEPGLPQTGSPGYFKAKLIRP